MSDSFEFTSPVGRIVSGDPTRAKDKDAEGKPLVIKNGPNTGQPRVEYYVGLAVPKGVEQHWNQTEWGLSIWNFARQCFPSLFDQQTGAMIREVAFKVTDGDSQVPNTKGTKPCDREGYPGHWIIHFSNGSQPKYWNKDGTETIDGSMIKRGYYAQIFAYGRSNASTQNPGLFLNLNMISLQGFGEEIHIGADASQVGFGQSALPPGASATPIGGLPPGAGTPPTPGAGTPPTPGAGTPPPTPGAGTPPPAPGAGTPPPAPGAGTPPPAPAHDLVQPGAIPNGVQSSGVPAPASTTVPSPGGAGVPPIEPSYNYNGAIYTRSQLLGMPGWTEAHLASLAPA